MIREANPTDVMYFCTAAKGFLEKTGDGRYLTLDEDWYSEVVFSMISSESFVLLVNEENGTPVAHCAMMLNESMFDGGQLVGKIFSTWGEGGFRLIREMELRAKALGCVVLMVDSHANMRQASIGKAYLKQGYEFSDQLFLKEL